MYYLEQRRFTGRDIVLVAWKHGRYRGVCNVVSLVGKQRGVPTNNNKKLSCDSTADKWKCMRDLSAHKKRGYGGSENTTDTTTNNTTTQHCD